RRRLLEYLVDRDDTKRIVWIYFNPSTRSIRKIGKISCPNLPSCYQHPNYTEKVTQIEVSDINYFLSYIPLLQKLINPKILKSINESKNLILWYTLHRYSSLLKQKKWLTTVYDCTDNWTNKD